MTVSRGRRQSSVRGQNAAGGGGTQVPQEPARRRGVRVAAAGSDPIVGGGGARCPGGGVRDLASGEEGPAEVPAMGTREGAAGVGSSPPVRRRTSRVACEDGDAEARWSARAEKCERKAPIDRGSTTRVSVRPERSGEGQSRGSGGQEAMAVVSASAASMPERALQERSRPAVRGGMRRREAVESASAMSPSVRSSAAKRLASTQPEITSCSEEPAPTWRQWSWPLSKS